MAMARSFVLLSIIFLASAAKIPSNIKKCNRKDPDFKQCLVQSAQSTVSLMDQPMKEVRLPALDPFEIPTLDIPSSGGSVSVDQKYKNCKIYGFTNGVFEKFDIDFENKKLDISGSFNEIKMQCQYKVDGKVLIMPVTGEGDSEMILTNLKATSSFGYEETKKNGKTFIKFNQQKLSLQLEKAQFRFDNLFNGNKAMSDNVNNVINENWEQIFQDTQEGFELAIGQIAMSILNGFFSKVSLEEAFDT